MDGFRLLKPILAGEDGAPLVTRRSFWRSNSRSLATEVIARHGTRRPTTVGHFPGDRWRVMAAIEDDVAASWKGDTGLTRAGCTAGGSADLSGARQAGAA